MDADTVIHVKVMGKGAYSGELEASYRVTKSDFHKAKITIPAQVYTGDAVTLDPADITVKADGVCLTPGTDYEILAESYTGNVKKGTAKVRIAGKGNYGGTKTVTFKIVSRRFVWFWKLLGSRAVSSASPNYTFGLKTLETESLSI